MNKPKTIVACRIFEHELRSVLEFQSPDNNVQVVWVDAALHSDPEMLKEEIMRAFSQAKDLGGSIHLLFGRGCLPEIESLAKENGARTIPVKNCIEAFLGERAAELEKDNTMLMTPTWLRTWPQSMKTLLGWNEIDFRMNLGRYDRILVVDPGLDPPTDEEILDFFDLSQVPVEVDNLDLHLFQNTVAGLLE